MESILLKTHLAQRSQLLKIQLGGGNASRTRGGRQISTGKLDVFAALATVAALAGRGEFVMRMSRSTAYAIGAVLQLAEAPPGVPIPCSKLAKLGEMPERFLLQILRNLVNHGMLKSTRGVDGGYSLARPAAEITLLHIFEATDGPLTPSIPPLDSLPAASQKKLLKVLGDITTASCQTMSRVSLRELSVVKSGGGTSETAAPE